MNTGRTRFKKGIIPWNKGKKDYLKGKVITWADKISLSKKSSLKSRLASQKAGKNMGKRNIGRRFTEEHKRKLSEIHKRIGSRPPINRGKDSHFWKGGISFEPYTTDWTEILKESIRERDNHICQECGIHQDEINYKLHVHHIDYDKKNCNPTNLIALCRKCHIKTNQDRSYWINYFRGFQND